jgi:hypothetical protein
VHGRRSTPFGRAVPDRSAPDAHAVLPRRTEAYLQADFASSERRPPERRRPSGRGGNVRRSSTFRRTRSDRRAGCPSRGGSRNSARSSSRSAGRATATWRA